MIREQGTFPCPKCGKDAKVMVAMAMKHLMCQYCWRALSRCERLVVVEQAYRNIAHKKVVWAGIADKVWAGWGEQ